MERNTILVKGKNSCGHEATQQEYEQMIRGHTITCFTCQKLLSLNAKSA